MNYDPQKLHPLVQEFVSSRENLAEKILMVQAAYDEGHNIRQKLPELKITNIQISEVTKYNDDQNGKVFDREIIGEFIAPDREVYKYRISMQSLSQSKLEILNYIKEYEEWLSKINKEKQNERELAYTETEKGRLRELAAKYPEVLKEIK